MIEFFCKNPKLPCRGVPRKMCSWNMQQIYRKTFMPKCNFSKVALQLYWNPINLMHISRTFFSKNSSGWLLLKNTEQVLAVGYFCKNALSKMFNKVLNTLTFKHMIFQEHVLNCQFRRILCKQCQEFVVYFQHQNECPNLSLSCTGCSMKVQRKDMEVSFFETPTFWGNLK